MNEKLSICLPRVYEYVNDCQYSRRNESRVALGPRESWIVWQRDCDEVSSGHVHQECKDLIHERLKRDGESIRHVTLGVKGAFMILWGNGDITGNLFGEYEKLEAILTLVEPGDIVVSAEHFP
jgi:hypothetical protein